MPELPPVGICRCGCGEPTEIATKTNYKRGAIRGEPQRFRKGHGAKRKPDHAKTVRPTRSEAARERNRQLQVFRNREAAERAVRRKAAEERRARRAQFVVEATPHIQVYRIEKKRHENTVARLIEEAKAQLQREDDALKLARRGGRPKKVVNG